MATKKKNRVLPKAVEARRQAILSRADKLGVSSPVGYVKPAEVPRAQAAGAAMFTSAPPMSPTFAPPGGGGLLPTIAGLDAFKPAAPPPEDPYAAYRGLLTQLLGAPPGPVDESAYTAPYDVALQQIQGQAQQAMPAIQSAGGDLRRRLGELQAQGTQRGEEYQRQIGTDLQRVLGNIQQGQQPVLNDLRAQGVNVAPIEALAQQRTGLISDQATMQEVLARRLQENAAQRGASTMQSGEMVTAGALGTLQNNLQTAINSLATQRAKAAQQAGADASQVQQEYLKSQRSLATQLGPMFLKNMEAQQPKVGVRGQFTGRNDTFATILNSALDDIDAGDPPEVAKAKIRQNAKKLKDQGYNVEDFGRQIDAYAKEKREGTSQPPDLAQLLRALLG